MNFYLFLLLAFLLGGIPFGLLIGYAFGKGDIRKLGSGNIGATNVWRVAGPMAGILALAADIAKGSLAVYLSLSLFRLSWPLIWPASGLVAAILVVAGHMFSPFLGFAGGKGVSAALGSLIMLLPIETLLALIVFVLTILISRYISLGSICAALGLFLTVFIERFVLREAIDALFLITAALIPALIIFAHRRNIRRLIDGTEPKFQLRRAAP
jgi:glycerol-3-phosphate acyltransferase PlsY